MKAESARIAVGFLLVTAVFGTFSAFAFWRVRQGLRFLRIPWPWTWHRVLRILDVVFSGALLVWMLVVYALFWSNYGH